MKKLSLEKNPDRSILGLKKMLYENGLKSAIEKFIYW